MSRAGNRRPRKRELKRTLSLLTESIAESPVGPSNMLPLEVSESVDISVFDKLSKTLEDLASKLGEVDAELEMSLRAGVVDRLRNYGTGKSELGKSLSEYKGVYKSKRQWTAVAAEIGAAINLSARTIFRMIDDYKASLEPAPTPIVETDRTAIDGPDLSKEEKRQRDARLAIRAFLNNVPNEKKKEVLAELLAEEAFQVWGLKESFELTVRPHPSFLTIDGRKKAPQSLAEERAA